MVWCRRIPELFRSFVTSTQLHPLWNCPYSPKKSTFILFLWELNFSSFVSSARFPFAPSDIVNTVKLRGRERKRRNKRFLGEWGAKPRRWKEAITLTHTLAHFSVFFAALPEVLRTSITMVAVFIQLCFQFTTR